MIRAVIIDDEHSCIETLAIELNAYCPEVEIIAKCEDPIEGLNVIRQLEPELLFLDIEMPHLNAFDLLESYGDTDFDVIFVTAYDQYAIRAFDFNAADYLLKPVQKTKLIQAVDKISRRNDHGLSSETLRAIVESIQNSVSPSPNIALPTIEGYEFVRIDTIVYAEANSNYTNIHLNSGDKLILSRTLKEVESMLTGHHFARIHQSYLVNLGHVRKYIKGAGGYIILHNGQSLNVSRNFKGRLLEMIRTR